ncbi:hypothetical protein [Halorubrum sp. LN27]|uniref:hypothetical protein n=1 Tax=Halorubrum sp. LN27 TaxID=2801032 RepID=UPI001F3E8FCD|nr:hypothetical protein [Halorubrum sp. LN27]
MKRRSFLLGTGSAAAGGSALIGTGAFSRIDAQRSVTIQVAEDDNAYLGMNDCIDGDGNETPNSSFADLDDLGHLRVDMGESGNGGSGVNSESISWFDNVFQLCNQGKEDVCLWISEKDGADPDRVTFYVNEEPETTTPEKLAFQDGDLVEDDPDLQTLTEVDDSILLEVGHCVCVGIQVYTREDDDYEITAPGAGDELLSEVSLVADVGEEACRAEPDCAEFVGEYSCTTYDFSEGDMWWKAQDTRFEVTNVGDASATFGWAIINDPDTDAGDGGAVVAPGESVDIEPSPPNPEEGVVFWDAPDGCDLPTWGDLKVDQFSDRLVNHAEDTTDISDDDYVAEIAIPQDVEETEDEDRKGELDEIPADGEDDEQALFDSLDGSDVTACRAEDSGDDPGT